MIERQPHDPVLYLHHRERERERINQDRLQFVVEVNEAHCAKMIKKLETGTCSELTVKYLWLDYDVALAVRDTALAMMAEATAQLAVQAQEARQRQVMTATCQMSAAKQVQL